MGLVGSFTGAAASANASPISGVKLAVSEINKAGGIAGKQIDLITGDDQNDPTSGVNEVRRLLEKENIHVLMGPLSSQITLAVAPLLNQAKMVSVSTSGSTALTPQVSNWHFSINPPADVQGRMMVLYAANMLKAKSIAWISDPGAQSKAALEAVKDQAATQKIAITGTQEFEIRSTDMTAQLLSLRRTNPDALLMWPNTGEDHANVIKSLAEIGWKVKVVNGGGSALFYAPAVKVYPDAFKGLPSVMLKSLTYCPSDPVGAGPFVKFKDRLKVAEGANFEKLAPVYAGWTYDGVYLLKAAIEAAKSVDGPTLTRWIEQNAKSFSGVSGSLSASSSNHFLFGSTFAVAMFVNPDKPRADGLFQRDGGC